MSTNETEHLQLHQWEKNDAFHTEEINENFAKIDTETAAIREELAAHTVPKAGTYTGNGGTTAINLGFRPRAVMVSEFAYTALVTGTGNNAKVKITNTGFQAVYDAKASISFNESGTVYFYLAM